MAPLRIALPLSMLLLGAGLLVTAAFAVPSRTTVRKGGTFRIALASLDATDPALEYGARAYLGATCAKLINTADTASARLVLEVAAGFPRVSLTLRKSYRFNTGRRVTAAAFARELNRVLNQKLQSGWAVYFADIAGAQDVLEGRATAASGIQARGYKLVLRLTTPVPDLAARLTLPAACSVPPTLRVDPSGIGAPIPAAGPYYIAEYVPGHRLVLKRNPYYRGPRPHRVDRFVASFVDTEASALSLVKSGQVNWADVGNDALIAGIGPRERARKSQFLLRPGYGLRYLFMNTSRGIFRNNPRLRRAVNFAIDRSALVREFGGPLVGRPTDDYIPAAVPGSLHRHIYPLKRPNLAKARALARGHLRGGHAVFYTTDSGWRVPQAQIVQQNLRKIGIEVEIRAFPPELYFTKIFDLKEPYDFGLVGFRPDYPDPYALLNASLSGQTLKIPRAANFARFNSPKYNRLLRTRPGCRGPPASARTGAWTCS